MANLTYNNSLYTRINKWDDEYSYKGVFVASKLNQKNGQDYKLLDAIDIDWDGIWFSSLGTYINTTDDLIEILNHINTTSDVNIFREQIDNINELLDTITASYVNTSYLGEVLTAYQQTLIAGPNIKIDKRTNVITTYGFLTYELLTAYATVAYVTDLRNEIYVNFPTINESYIIAYAQARSVVDAVIDGADKAFDTLKEIADWISRDGADAANLITRMEDLESQVEENEEVTATALIDLQQQINSMTGGAGSIQTQITNNINLLDSSVTLAGSTSSQPQEIGIDTSVDVLGSITVAEVDGLLDQASSSNVVLQADAAGAARKAYDTLYGTDTDTIDALTLKGVKARVNWLTRTGTLSVGSVASGTTLEYDNSTGNLATVQNIAEAINAIEMWETYSAS